ncbi:MAG: hypothetical protein IPJ79_02970 [Bacteroidetes bacterium]|nr:hypothetical protein [Bacteroidota bacterium]
MTINKNNYEAFFLDYHEKNLSPEQVADLLLFLEQHPQLQKEFDAFAAIFLSNDDAIVFEEKENLKKIIINAENFNEFAVANLEGDLTPQEIKQYAKFITDYPIYKKEESLFAKTKLHADLSLKFPDKQKLKKGKARIISLNMFYIAAAACVLLMLGMFFSKQQTNSFAPQTAEKAIENKVEDASEKSTASKSPGQYPVSNIQSASSNKPILNSQFPNTNSLNHQLSNSLNPKSEIRNLKSDIPLIEPKTAFIPEESFQLRLKSLQTFPVYLLDENYAISEPIQITPATAFENFKKDAVKKLEKSKQDSDENWFPENAFNPSKKTRLIDLFASAIDKISGNKVRIEPEYNEKGEMVSYDFTAGAFNFKKDLSK